tara:strand:+ start:139 stop:1869 length:1731 start_codon:yes stop_codon:yes gene_type:complete
MANKKINIDIQTKGAKKSKDELSGLTGAINKVGKAAGIASAAYFGAKGLIGAFSSVIEASARQEQAEKALEVALGKTSKSLLDQASALQQMTTAGDEAIIEQQAFLASLKFTEDQIKTIIPVALDLSAATGISLESAVRNTSKTFSGLAGELGELVPQLRDLTQEEMKAGKAVEVLGDLFEGQAAKQSETLAGSLTQMSNAVGDAGEAIGSLLSPIVISTANAIKTLAEGVGDVVERFKNFGTEVEDVIITALGKEAPQSLEEFKSSLSDLNITGLEALGNQLIEQQKNLTGFNNRIEDVDAFDVLLEKLLLVNEELEKQNKTYDELNTAVDRSINIRRAEADSIDFVAQKEAMSNEERLALRQTFSEQMNSMFNSDFDMQRVLMSQQVEAFKAAEISQSEITKFEVEKRKQIRASEISFQAGAVSQLIGGLSQLNQASAGSAKVNARLAQAQALIDTYAGANKALASAPPPFNFVLAGSVIAAGLANVLTISRSMGDLKAFATGGDFVTSGPQMIMVGDNPGGRERVQVTPLSSPNINGPQGINVNIQGNIIGTQEFVRDTLIPEINNTIQNNLA